MKTLFKKKTLAISLLTMALLFVAGCGDDAGKSSDVGSTENTLNTLDDPSTTEVSASTSTTEDDEARDIKLTLYFANDQADKLEKEVREIKATTDAVLALAISELIEGPKTEGHFATIPEGSKLLGIDLADGIAKVNMSQEFKDNHGGGSTGEMMTVYSIVDTLTEFENVKAVQFLIEDKEIDTLAGHLDLTSPLKRETDIIAAE